MRQREAQRRNLKNARTRPLRDPASETHPRSVRRRTAPDQGWNRPRYAPSGSHTSQYITRWTAAVLTIADTSVEFREAARILGEHITTADMADAVGMSTDTIRQARLGPGTSGYRNPPENWPKVIRHTAFRRAKGLVKLAQSIAE